MEFDGTLALCPLGCEVFTDYNSNKKTLENNFKPRN